MQLVAMKSKCLQPVAAKYVTDAHSLQFSIACSFFHGAVGKAHMVENRWNSYRGDNFWRDLLGGAFKRSASTQQLWRKEVQSGHVTESGVLWLQ